MSEILFQHSDLSRRVLRFRLAALAVAMTGLVVVGSLWISASFYGVAGPDAMVTVNLTNAGDSLGINSTVRYHGLRVGRVVDVEQAPNDQGQYAATVIVNEQHAPDIPTGVIARLLPSTVLGSEYIELRMPTDVQLVSSGTLGLSDGDVISADTSAEALRIMDAFNAIYRVASVIDPETIGMAVGQVADALRGRGRELGKSIGQANKLSKRFAKAEPSFYRDLDYLATNLDTVAALQPSIAAALRDLIPLARTVKTKAGTIHSALTSFTLLSSTISDFLDRNGVTLEQFMAAVEPTFAVFSESIAPFSRILAKAPEVLSNGANAIDDKAINMIAKFALDFGNPYSSADCPRYGQARGANCR